MKNVRVEKVVLVGISDAWIDKKAVEVQAGGKTWEAEVITTKGVDGKANFAVVRDPRTPITKDWTIKF
jgi:alpha 1,3-glucosidase